MQLLVLSMICLSKTVAWTQFSEPLKLAEPNQVKSITIFFLTLFVSKFSTKTVSKLFVKDLYNNLPYVLPWYSIVQMVQNGRKF